MSRRTRKGRRDEGQKHPSVSPSSYAPELGVLLGGRVTECELSVGGLLLPPGWTGDPQAGGSRCVVDRPRRTGSVPAWVGIPGPSLLSWGPPFKTEDVMLIWSSAHA